MNFCAAVLILKMEEDTRHFWCIMLYFKKGKNATKTQKKICAVYGEGAVTEHVKRGLLVSVSGLLTFWLNDALLRGCLMHGRMCSSTPGLCPLDVSSGRQLACSKFTNQ